jgi:hypothetical protein
MVQAGPSCRKITEAFRVAFSLFDPLSPARNAGSMAQRADGRVVAARRHAH